MLKLLTLMRTPGNQESMANVLALLAALYLLLIIGFPKMVGLYVQQQGVVSALDGVCAQVRGCRSVKLQRALAGDMAGHDTNVMVYGDIPDADRADASKQFGKVIGAAGAVYRYLAGTVNIEFVSNSVSTKSPKSGQKGAAK